MPEKLSLIIPVKNEAASLPLTFKHLAPFRETIEIIVVDGGSTDKTLAFAEQQADLCLRTLPSRAGQMNAGARAANHNILVFLHADTLLPANTPDLISHALRTTCWGRFNIRLSGKARCFRVIERLINWRSRITGVATGDQAIFVRKPTFEAIGGFPNIPLMEDVALSKKLRRLKPPACIQEVAITSSRRWEQHGLLRTIITMWLLRAAYFFGVNPKRLARIYYSAKNNAH